MLKIKNPWLEDLIGLFYPHLCCACFRRLNKEEKVLCFHCLFDIPKTNYHLYEDNPVAKKLWGRVPIQQATSLYFFAKKGKVQNLIHQLKYKGRQDIGFKLGQILGKQLKEAKSWDIDVVLPIPLHPKKFRKRGYNQSDSFAKGLAHSMNCTYFTDAIVRTVHSKSQTKKGKEARWENVANVFEIQKAEALHDAHLLLIDDVITTGATMEACAQSLLQLKNVKISIATIACAELLN